MHRKWAFVVTVAVMLLQSGCDGYTSVNGKIRDSSGAPVSGASVSFGSSSRDLAVRGLSAADGSYRVGSRHAP
jgi:hypothetical protein